MRHWTYMTSISWAKFIDLIMSNSITLGTNNMCFLGGCKHTHKAGQEMPFSLAPLAMDPSSEQHMKLWPLTIDQPGSFPFEYMRWHIVGRVNGAQRGMKGRDQAPSSFICPYVLAVAEDWLETAWRFMAQWIPACHEAMSQDLKVDCVTSSISQSWGFRLSQQLGYLRTARSLLAYGLASESHGAGIIPPADYKERQFNYCKLFAQLLVMHNVKVHK